MTAPNTITVIPESPAKRREYEEEIIRTFYLSNADVKETLDVLRLVVDNRRLSPVRRISAIPHQDTPEKIDAAAKVISAIDKARAEVVIGVELLEVDRIKMPRVGLQNRARLGQAAGGISGTVRRTTATTSRSAIFRSLTQGDIYPDRRTRAVLPPAEERHSLARARQSAAAHLRGLDHAGALASACRCRASHSCRSRPAA